MRGDAAALPFADATFDAVSCFAALYLIEEPFQAIAEIARVLAPGGRVALLSSVNRGLAPTAATNALVRGLSGVRIFGRDDLTGALRDHGLIDVRRRLAGFAQFVSGKKPTTGAKGAELVAKDHGPSVKNDKQYEGLRKKGMSKERAAKIANTPDASKKGGKNSGKKS